MSQKWASYVITAVRYEQTGHSYVAARIVAVEVRMDLGGRIGDAEIWRREQILNAVHQDHETFVTARMSASGSWAKGAHVHLTRSNGVDYIRADRHLITQDNLGNLAEF